MDINEAVGALIQSFRDAAIEKGEFHPDSKRDAKLHNTMARAFAGLRGYGDEGQNAFRKLLSNDSDAVVGWVAAQLLYEHNLPEARNALKRIASGDGLLAFDAEITLEEYDKGRLGSPFGKYGKRAL